MYTNNDSAEHNISALNEVQTAQHRVLEGGTNITSG